jgi:RNA-binding motif X-linked protein 2
MMLGEIDSEADNDTALPEIDPEDPMRDYLIAQHRERITGNKKRKKAEGETQEERMARKAKKKRKRTSRDSK